MSIFLFLSVLIVYLFLITINDRADKYHKNKEWRDKRDERRNKKGFTSKM